MGDMCFGASGCMVVFLQGCLIESRSAVNPVGRFGVYHWSHVFAQRFKDLFQLVASDSISMRENMAHHSGLAQRR